MIEINRKFTEALFFVPSTLSSLHQHVNPYPAGTKSDLVAFATSIEPHQPTHPCSLTRLYTVG